MKQQREPASFEALKAASFIRGESTLSVVCERPFEEVALQLEGCIAANALGIVHVHDFGRLLRTTGMALDLQCRVYEVCNPRLAAQLIALDPGLAHVLPCRISMHNQGGVTTVTTPMPSAVMTEFSHAADVARLARTFEAGLQPVLRGLR